MSLCRSCGAEIIWADTPNGETMPLDAKSERRLILNHGDRGPGTLAVVRETYVSHFATCPMADEHRK